MLKATRKPIHILIIEDCATDARVLIEMLKESRIVHEYRLVRDGAQALWLLLHGRATPLYHPPDLIILDLNLPKRDGREILQKLKEHPNLRFIPVLVLSSSQDENDRRHCQELHACSYVEKPWDLAQYDPVIKAIESLWLEVNKPGGKVAQPY